MPVTDTLRPSNASRRRPGRPAGDTGSRGAIEEAARRLFAEAGFAKTSVRAVAKSAGVDPGLVRHYFGTKEELLRAVVVLPVDPEVLVSAVAAGGADGAGRRLATVIVGLLHDSERIALLTAIIRAAATEPEGAAIVRDVVTGQVLEPLVAALGVDNPRLRGSLIASQVVGFFMGHQVVGLVGLTGADDTTLVEALAGTLQRYLTGDIHATPGSSGS